MPVERIPGERMYIDWVGDQPELLLDPATGEVKKVHVFTTTLGFSSCVYAEIFLNEKLTSFISGVVHALSFYGAVPKYLVPDNLKSAISKHSKDELVLNSVFSDLEDFYDTVVLPPPPRKPKGTAFQQESKPPQKQRQRTSEQIVRCVRLLHACENACIFALLSPGLPPRLGAQA